MSVENDEGLANPKDLPKD